MKMPAGVDEAAVRRTMLTNYNIEVGAGLGPLAGKIWRVGLMGASSTPQTLLQFLAACEGALAMHAQRAGRRVTAASASLRAALVTARGARRVEPARIPGRTPRVRRRSNSMLLRSDTNVVVS